MHVYGGAQSSSGWVSRCTEFFAHAAHAADQTKHLNSLLIVKSGARTILKQKKVYGAVTTHHSYLGPRLSVCAERAYM